jgi:hypothetical protein
MRGALGVFFSLAALSATAGANELAKARRFAELHLVHQEVHETPVEGRHSGETLHGPPSYPFGYRSPRWERAHTSTLYKVRALHPDERGHTDYRFVLRDDGTLKTAGKPQVRRYSAETLATLAEMTPQDRKWWMRWRY